MCVFLLNGPHLMCDLLLRDIFGLADEFWVINVSSRVSYRDASCWSQVALLFIQSSPLVSWPWGCQGQWDVSKLLLESVLLNTTFVFRGRFIWVFSLGCSHELFFSVFSNHWKCSGLLYQSGGMVGFENVSQATPNLIQRVESECNFTTESKRSQNHRGNKAEKLLSWFWSFQPVVNS